MSIPRQRRGPLRSSAPSALKRNVGDSPRVRETYATPSILQRPGFATVMGRMLRRAIPLIALCGAMWSAVATAGTVSPEALAQARRAGDAMVIVALRSSTAEAPGRGRRAHRRALDRLRRAVLGDLPAGEVEIAHVYRAVAGFSGRLSARALERLANDPDVVRVDLDEVGHAALQSSVPQIGADRVHARGVDGSGTTIAVLDAGVEAAQPDIAGALVAEACFCRGGRVTSHRTRAACCPGGVASAAGPGSAAAVNRHGPHVAGIAVSRGRVASLGVAPGARLVAVRVLDSENLGFISDWVAALDWVASERPDVRVVNMSLVSAALFNGDCERGCAGSSGCAANLLFADAMEQLWARGALVVAAAGNDGRPNVMSSPACVSRAVAVGAVDVDDAVWTESNSSPTLDLLAPGVEIVSDGLDGGLLRLSGTSMAAPHVAGTAALLISARPGLGAADVLALLRQSGHPITDRRTGRRTPRVDAFAALQAAMLGVDFARGGGARATDCLLEWNFIPPSVVRSGARMVARCVDNDPQCDFDTTVGQCTFALSLCFNMRDPLLRACAVDEPLETFHIFSPRVDAPPDTVERANVDALAYALPEFPLALSDACSIEIPYVVPRPGPGAGIDRIRMRVGTASRSDYDHVVLECAAP